MPSPWAPRYRASPRRLHRFSLLTAACAALITLYGGLLRFEALQGQYGRLDQPRWSRAAAAHAVPVARSLRPAAVRWRPVATPYAGGDPINYLRYAREMRHFYQAHVREPVFLSLTRAWLWLTGNRDIALSFASATGGTLAVLATFLLGAAAVSRVVGLAAAGALAIELEAVSRSSGGWRDDTFMLFVAVAAWAFVRLHQRPARSGAVVAGIAAAGACLTRITALAFVLPAFLWMIVEAPRENRGVVARQVAIAWAVCALLIAPYLVNCALATGDPFFAINYHTRYYRAADGLPEDHSVSALAYVRGKIAARPLSGLDTAVTGLVVWPFEVKWGGFQLWWRGLGEVLRWSAAAGLVLALWFPVGRLLLLILFTSLVPYALTWSSGGGGDWRFSQHVYPLYLVSAFAAATAIVAAARAVARRQVDWTRALPRQRAMQIGTAALLLILSAGVYSVLPFLVARETLMAGLPVNITAGDRDGWFFKGRWSPPIRNGVPVRVAQSAIVSMRVPFPEAREYAITVRIDPPEGRDGVPPRITMFVNRHALAHVQLDRNPERMGSYRMTLPRSQAGESVSQLDFVATHTVPASEAGGAFAELPLDTPVAFRLWYVRIEPIEQPVNGGSRTRP